MRLTAKSALAGLAIALAFSTASIAADIKIGVLVPTTGGQATYGQDMANAVQLAMDEINKAGGDQYSAVIGDDGCDPQQAVNAATKLASSGISAVIGGYCSGATIPTLKIFGDAKLPFVITAANSTKLIPANPGNAFMINSTGNDQVAKAMDVWKAKGYKALAIVNEGDAYSQDLATLAQKSFTDAGGKVVDFETVNHGEQDFSAVVTKIKAANPDAVFWTAYDDDGGPFI
jgi:branched-chain amino acid transport system substrate-binding protein